MRLGESRSTCSLPPPELVSTSSRARRCSYGGGMTSDAHPESSSEQAGSSAEVIESKILDIREGGRRGVYREWGPKGRRLPRVIAQSTVRLSIFGISGPRWKNAIYTETLPIGSVKAGPTSAKPPTMPSDGCVRMPVKRVRDLPRGSVRLSALQEGLE